MNFLNQITVRARIIALFVIILFLLAIFGAFTLQKNETLFGLTRTLYNHPLQVSNAALKANTGIVRMHRGMKDISIAKNDFQINQDIQVIAAEEQKVYQHLDIVQKFILGEEGKKLAKETIEMFGNWKPIRMEVQALVHKGDRDAAIEITRGKGVDYVVRLERQMKELSGYAQQKADGYMAQAEITHQEIKRGVIWAILLVAVISFAAAFLVINSIAASLGFLKDKMAAITSSGAMSPVEMAGKNEITELASYFNSLMTVLQDQMSLRENLNKLNRELGGEMTVNELTEKSIRFVARALDSCAAAFYIFDPKDDICKLNASFAFVEREYLASQFSLGEGIIGQVAVERQPILLKNITRDKACANSGTTSEPPKNIYSVPVVFEKELLAVMEIASFELIDPIKKQFVDEAAAIIASRLNITIQSIRINDLFKETQAANEQLQAKTDQINASNEELTAINKELESQKDELQAQKNELQAQASELESKRIQVEEANRLKSEFLSNMSHELRTPLNSIMSLSQLLISRGVDKDPAKATEFLQVIDRNGRQLLNLINDILDLTKIESGRMELYPTKFESEQLVNHLLQTVQPIAEAKDLRIEKNIARTLSIFSDEDKIYQILLNFLSNAVKFTKKGVVTLEVKEINDKVSFVVKDTGIGIAAENLYYIFDEFRQIDGSFTREHEGTGLGLAISKKLAILLGGNITVESTVNVGSTFVLTLPININDQIDMPLDSGSKPTPLPSVISTGKATAPTVLVIDDEKDARTKLSAYLTEGGYQVIAAKSGNEGLKLARERQPDVISLDLLMPNMDGWEVLKLLKQDPETIAIPVVITSVSKDKETGWALGAAGYISKPVNKQLLLAEIRRVCGVNSRMRLLIVDDDKGVQEFLKNFLVENGFVVDAAGNGREALARVSAAVPHLIILDLLMPDMDGFTVLEQLRENPATKNLPVIVLTGKDLTKSDFKRLNTSVKTIRKDKLDKEIFLQHIKAALACPAEKKPVERSGPPRILVVEDNEIASMQIRTALEENEFNVDVAEDGAIGLEKVEKNIPDAIVLDLMMPKVDGFQVLEQVRSKPETATLPVLILTAKELTTAERDLLSHNNIHQLIQKGETDRDQLVAIVKNMLAGASPSPPAPAKRKGSKTSGSGGILLVEDNPDNRLTVSAILDGEGYDLFFAEDGRQGVDAAKANQPDLILMDLQLPVMNGMDAIIAIRKDPLTRDIPIIAVTARAMKGDREGVLAAGANDYISKPIDPAEMIEKIRKWKR